MKTSDIIKVGACTLNRAFGYNPKVSLRLIEETGSIEALFRLSERKRDDLLGPFSRFQGLLSDDEFFRSEKELEELSGQGIQFVAYGEADFPSALAECPDSPAGLYIRSVSPLSEIFNSGPYISIVGTRDVSFYGQEWTRKIVLTLAQAQHKPTIVSGLAFGVDIMAHRAALEAGLRTIAVIPTGPEDIYPNAHRRYAEQIAGTPGCALVTDFPPGTGAQAATFLRRNRIIAGLSSATIVVESKRKGGSLITAHTAFDYGRDVWALPGRIDDVRSAGCNSLFREKVAEPIADVEALPDALGLGTYNRRRKAELEEEVRDRYSGSTDADTLEKLCRIAVCIKLNRGICVEELAEQLGIDYVQTATLVGTLETGGFIVTDLMQRCMILVRS
ncbi:MAG: DNA-processing protein DprA [Bacteroidales bacterium]|nr:DNA-processing protein DprA [Bacteroidales bacterium]